MSLKATNLIHLYVAIGTMIGFAAGVWGGIGLATDSAQSLSQDLRRTQLHPLTRAGILAVTTPFFGALGVTGGVCYGFSWPITIPLTVMFLHTKRF